jgi:hypothetical protein
MFPFPFAFIIIAVVAVVAAIIYFNKDSKPPVVDLMDPRNWEIGPIMNGENYSVNMPLHPSIHPDGWYFDLPYPNAEAGSAHYITVPATLSGKTGKITLKYRLETDAQIVPCKFPDNQATLSLYFQRDKDKWTAQYEAFRWYASTQNITAGEHVLEADLGSDWGAVLRSTSKNNEDGFMAAVHNSVRVGFVLGGGDGLGHGVYATGPAKFIVTSFTIE